MFSIVMINSESRNLFMESHKGMLSERKGKITQNQEINPYIELLIT